MRAIAPIRGRLNYLWAVAREGRRAVRTAIDLVFGVFGVYLVLVVGYARNEPGWAAAGCIGMILVLTFEGGYRRDVRRQRVVSSASPIALVRDALRRGRTVRERLVYVRSESSAEAGDLVYEWATEAWEALDAHVPEYADGFYGPHGSPALGRALLPVAFETELQQDFRGHIEDLIDAKLDYLARIVTKLGNDQFAAERAVT